MKKNMILRILFTVIGILLTYGAVAFNVKVAIGVGPIDAAITTIAQIIGMKVGTFSMIFHGSFFLGQILIKKKDFKMKDCLQLFFIIGGGYIWNFFLYTVLRNVEFTLYPVRLLVFILSNIVSAFGCLLVLDMQVMKTPLEGFLQLFAEKRGTTLGKCRQVADISLLLLSVVLILIFGTEWTVREGTVISALIYGPALDLLRKHVVSKWKFLQEK